MTTEMDAVMKKHELLASTATLKIPLSHLGRPQGARLLSNRLHCNFRGQAKPDWTGSWEMPREAAAEEVLWMEKISFRNVKPVVYTRPPERPTQTADYAKPSHVQISCL